MQRALVPYIDIVGNVQSLPPSTLKDTMWPTECKAKHFCVGVMNVNYCGGGPARWRQS